MTPIQPSQHPIPNEHVNELIVNKFSLEDGHIDHLGHTIADEGINDVEESDNDMEWEEIDVLQDEIQLSLPTESVEVELDIPNATKKKPARKIDPLARILRLESHKLHTVALLASYSRRNKWINNPLLHARLLSITPLPLQISFSMIHKKTQPDPSRRARLFEVAIFKLTEWWHNFFHVLPNKGVRSQTYMEVESQWIKETKGKGRQEEDESFPWSDQLRTVNSLMKHALMREGSADTSALLFTALCRALDIPARLTVSLQAVPWSSRVGKPRGDDNNGADRVQPPSKAVNIRRSRAKDRNSRTLTPRTSSVEPPLGGWPPVIWTEVFSRPEGRWVPVDPIRYLVDKKKMFEPPPQCRTNRMVYVVSFEEDGCARDVTLRYARQFAAKTSRQRALTKRGQSEWWENVISILKRPYRLHRDDVEDGELQSLQYIEGMPTTISGFKDHPIYVIERHLRKDEIIYPLDEVGKFRGESVYPRANVQRVRSAETWMREGRSILIGQQPLKRVPHRATTINRKRFLELAKSNMPEEEPTQGLYAEWQTELYTPDPVVEGVIPTNDFGNINLFVPSMLPYGAAHLPFQGIARVARELGIRYAPAVTGFEFRKGHANPIVTGIVVASENEDVVLSAYWTSIERANETERLKQHDRVIRRWSQLIQGLRLRKRLQDEYGHNSRVEDTRDDSQHKGIREAGGFITEYTGIVERFQLPKTRNTFPDLVSTPPELELEYDPHREWSPQLVEPRIGEIPGRSSLSGVPHRVDVKNGLGPKHVKASQPKRRLRNRAKRHRNDFTSGSEASEENKPSVKKLHSSNVSTGRQLRARTQKSKAQLEREKAHEDAIQDAVEE